mmetsp:Transcript_1422/g.2077  ORF Transcript_1422/g.2077 Transcript_1422/m.2077 type:complete len:577 (+) Transcript_1422:187-1917(+)
MSVEELQQTACLVRVTGPDPKGVKVKDRAFYVTTDDGYTTLSASGILINRSKDQSSPKDLLVACSASLIASFRELGEDGSSPKDKLIPRCNVDMCVGDGGGWHRLDLIKIITIDGIRTATESLVGGSVRDVRGISIGSVAIFRATSFIENVYIPTLEVFASAKVRKGDKLMIISSPFGLVSPHVFQNSITTGIVSNVVPFERMRKNKDFPPALLLTDARCLPGSEGAPAFDSKGRIIGIVAPTLHRGEKFSLELGAIIPIDLFADALDLEIDGQNPLKNNMMNPTAVIEKESGLISSPHSSFSLAIRKCSSAVVLVRVRSAWGSGIVVSPYGHILTCAHLVRPFTQKGRNGALTLRLGTKIMVSLRDAGSNPEFQCEADLLFCSQGAVDVALLKMNVNFKTKAAKLPKTDEYVYEGQPCVASGHAIFHPSSNLSCTVSAGVVSRVVSSLEKKDPALLQTSASVFRGHSGGLLADHRGNFIGMLTSNAKHSNGDIIPTINFSIPVNVLRPLIDVCNKNEADMDIVRSVYYSFDELDKELAALWSLQVGGGPPTTPPHEIVQEGSRFKDFLSKFSSKL